MPPAINPSGTLIFVGSYYAEFYAAGAEMQMLQIARALRRRGWRIGFAAGEGPHPPGARLPTTEFPVLRLHSALNFSRRAVTDNARWLAALQADWYYHRGIDALLPATRRAARSANGRLLWASGSDIETASRPFRARREGLGAPFSRRGLQLLWIDRTQNGRIQRCLAEADLRLAQHEGQARILESRGLPATVIPNGWPIPPSPGPKPERLQVAWVANLKPLKRVEQFYSIITACADWPIDFHIIGRIEPESETEAQRMAHAHPNLKIYGALSSDRVEERLAQCHVLVNTSLYEGFPNTFLQAWSRGAVVLTTGVNPGGILDGSALGEALASPEAVAARLREWSPLSAALANQGRKAYGMFAHRFSIEITTDRMVAAMRSAAATPRP